MASEDDGRHDDWSRDGTRWFHVGLFLRRSIHPLTLHLRFRLWNYNPENNDKQGDDWNGENFSWFSHKQAVPPSPLSYEQDSALLDNGGRILDAVVRPYPAKTAGIPVSFVYEMNTGTFSFAWDNRAGHNVETEQPYVSTPPQALRTPLTSRETEIFIPLRLTLGREVIVKGLEDGDRWTYDTRRQTLFIVTENDEPGHRHQVQVSVYPQPKPSFTVNDFWSDFGSRMITVSITFLAFVCWLLIL